MAAWMLDGGCVGEEAGSTKPCVFLCKVAAASDEGQPVCGPFWCVIGSLMVFCNACFVVFV